MRDGDKWAFFTDALPEIVRSLMALGLVFGGLASIIAMAFLRSLDDAARLAGLVSGVMGAGVAYYLTKGVAEAAQRTARAEAQGRVRAQTAAVRLRAMLSEMQEETEALANAEKEN